MDVAQLANMDIAPDVAVSSISGSPGDRKYDKLLNVLQPCEEYLKWLSVFNIPICLNIRPIQILFIGQRKVNISLFFSWA